MGGVFMNLNIECMREIIKYCADNIDYVEGVEDSWGESFVDLTDLYNAVELKQFNKKDIMYSVLKLYEYKYIELCDIYPMNKSYLEKCTVCDITVQGHNFLSSIQDDTLWNKTKNIVGKVGNHTLKFIEDTAQMVAIESAKQAVTVMMTTPK